MLLKIDFLTSYEILFDGLSAHSFPDLTKNRGYHVPFRVVLNAAKCQKQNRAESRVSSSVTLRPGSSHFLIKYAYLE